MVYFNAFSWEWLVSEAEVLIKASWKHPCDTESKREAIRGVAWRLIAKIWGFHSLVKEHFILWCSPKDLDFIKIHNEFDEQEKSMTKKCLCWILYLVLDTDYKVFMNITQKFVINIFNNKLVSGYIDFYLQIN